MSLLEEKTPESLSIPSLSPRGKAMWGQREKAVRIYKTGGEVSPETTTTLILDFQTSRNNDLILGFRCLQESTILNLQKEKEGFPGDAVVKIRLPMQEGDARVMHSILGLEISPRVGDGNLLQHSCLENPKNRGAWQTSPWGHKDLDTTEQLSPHTHTQREGIQGMCFVSYYL